MKIIPLTQGYSCWVDDEDYAALAIHKWHVKIYRGGTCCYAARNVPAVRRGKSAQVTLMMHVVIAQPGAGQEVDHVNHLSGSLIIDNRRSNLRVVTSAQNQHGKRKTSAATTSAFKGVCWRGAPRDKWFAQITKAQGSRRHRGYFANETDAALAYDRAAIEHFGEFARTNILGPHAIYASLPLSPNPDNSPPLW